MAIFAPILPLHTRGIFRNFTITTLPRKVNDQNLDFWLLEGSVNEKPDRNKNKNEWGNLSQYEHEDTNGTNC